jgi:hypothetical protein
MNRTFLRVVTGFSMIMLTSAILVMSGPAQSQQPTAPYPAKPAVTAVVPYQGAVYGGNPGMAPDQVREMLGLLKSIDTRLESINRQLGGEVAIASHTPTLASVASSKCVKCHSADKPKGDFIMFGPEGALKPFSAREKAEMKKAVDTKHMPPPEAPQLTAAERAAF